MLWLVGLIFLFLFQMLTEFIAAIYAFGLLQTNIPPELVAAILMFSPFGLLTVRRQEPRWLLPGALVISLLARAILPFLSTRGIMVAAGVGIAALFFILPLLLQKMRPPDVLLGLSMAVVTAALLRAWGAGLDPTTQGHGGWLGLPLVILAGYLVWHHRQELTAPPPTEDTPPSNVLVDPSLIVLVLGLMSIFTLLYFAFVAPNVLARWVGLEPEVAFFLFAIAVITWIPVLVMPDFFTPHVPRIFTFLFGLSLVLTILAYQTPFPPNPEAYPLFEPTPPFWAPLMFVLMILTFPVLLFNFAVLQEHLDRVPYRPPALGLAFGLGTLYLFMLILGHVSTTTYDYIPVVGPFFRNRFWMVHLVPILVLVGSLRMVSYGKTSQDLAALDAPWTPVPYFLLLALSIATLVLAWGRAPHPKPPQEATTTLRVVTYNIQQGYRQDGLRGVQDQLDLLKELQPDLIGLQESDTNRITNGNMDVVGYFASELGMYAYYGPKVVHGTFGIALLSRYPLENPRTFFMYSQREQTATIQARISVHGQVFHVFVTHLDNDGPIIQQENILQVIGDLTPVILMGDFNFRPDTPPYRLTTERLVDAWRQRWPQGVDEQGTSVEDRIDHIFLSPDLEVLDIRYIFDPASDHPAVLAVLTWP